MFRRDDAPSATETEQASESDTSSGENASTLPPATTDTTSTTSPSPVPSSTGRGLMVVETSTSLESHSLSTPSADPTLSQPDTPTSSITTAGSRSADIPSSTMLFYSSPASSSVYSILPVSEVAPIPTSSGSASADIPSSTTLVYSIATATNPTPTIAPVSISPWYSILPVSASSSTSADTISPFTSLFYSIVTAADPAPASISPWYSILPVSDVTAIPTSSSSISADTIPSSTMLFYSIVTAADPAPTADPASSSTTSVYSILPVSDITTISVSSSSASADTSISSSTTFFYSTVTAADPTPASILPVSDTTTISPLSVLPVSESTTPDLAPESTLVYSVLPVSGSSSIIDRLLDASTPTTVPTSTLFSPGIIPTTGPSKSTSNYPVAITPAKDAYHSTTVTGTSTTLEEAPTTSRYIHHFTFFRLSNPDLVRSQRINNLALQPTADAGSSTVLVTSGSITRTFVVRPTGGTITGVGGTESGSGEGPSSGDTRSHHAPPISIILGSVLAGVILILVLVVFVVRRRRRQRVARWHRLPYEPALDTSRHSSRFLNPFTDIDDDWSMIASEVERPSTTTASTLAFAPSREDDSVSGDYTTRRPSFGILRSEGWR